MDAIQFTTVIGPDGLIHPPEGVDLPVGEIEVSVKSRIKEPAAAECMAGMKKWLLDAAAQSEASNVVLPHDMAEQHDHYAHGAPKR